MRIYLRNIADGLFIAADFFTQAIPVVFPWVIHMGPTAGHKTQVGGHLWGTLYDRLGMSGPGFPLTSFLNSV